MSTFLYRGIIVIMVISFVGESVILAQQEPNQKEEEEISLLKDLHESFMKDFRLVKKKLMSDQELTPEEQEEFRGAITRMGGRALVLALTVGGTGYALYKGMGKGRNAYKKFKNWWGGASQSIPAKPENKKEFQIGSRITDYLDSFDLGEEDQDLIIGLFEEYNLDPIDVNIAKLFVETNYKDFQNVFTKYYNNEDRLHNLLMALAKSMDRINPNPGTTNKQLYENFRSHMIEQEALGEHDGKAWTQESLSWSDMQKNIEKGLQAKQSKQNMSPLDKARAKAALKHNKE